VTLVTLSFGFLEGAGTPTADATFEYEQTPAGLQLIPTALGTEATVRLNGRTVATVDPESAGQPVLLPTAPGDRITVVTSDRERSVLVDRTTDDRSEVGDLIAYYTFDQREDATVVDRSGNDNDGTARSATGNPDGYDRGRDGTGTYMRFDGEGGTHVDMGDLAVRGASVDEITVAITYRKNFGTSGCGGVGDIQNLIEHQPTQASSFAWFLETDRNRCSDPHDMTFNVGFNNPPSAELAASDVPEREPQVLVGTYDGSEMALYRNGTRVGTRSLDRSVDLGEVILAADSDPSIQNFRGRIYEVRLYYTAFSESEAAVLTKAMPG
jgi:hypothetical protein